MATSPHFGCDDAYEARLEQRRQRTLGFQKFLPWLTALFGACALFQIISPHGNTTTEVVFYAITSLTAAVVSVSFYIRLRYRLSRDATAQFLLLEIVGIAAPAIKHAIATNRYKNSAIDLIGVSVEIAVQMLLCLAIVVRTAREFRNNQTPPSPETSFNSEKAERRY